MAGPKLAMSLVQEMGGAPLSPPMSIGGAGGIAIDPTNWKIERIASLKRLLSGKDAREELNRRQSFMWSLEARDRFRLDCLRSVSPAHRHAMYMAGSLARQERLRRLEWEHELSELTGGIL